MYCSEFHEWLIYFKTPFLVVLSTLQLSTFNIRKFGTFEYSNFVKMGCRGGTPMTLHRAPTRYEHVCSQSLWSAKTRGNMSCPDLEDHSSNKVQKHWYGVSGVGCHPNTVSLHRLVSRHTNFRVHTWNTQQPTHRITSSGFSTCQCNCIFTTSESHDGLGCPRNMKFFKI
jgi:hypothetical protein